MAQSHTSGRTTFQAAGHYGHEFLGDGRPLPDEDHPDYVAARGYDLADLMKGA
jgi:hypothetical protein